ncbi:unnamed protein product [Alopecurus aequalis]
MRTSQALSYAVFLLLLLLTSSSSSYASVLEDTCRYHHRDYNYRMKFFQADKDSATANKHGLAVIAIKIARAVSVSTLKHITALKDADKDKKMQGPLADCYAVYAGSVSSFDKATRDIASGKLQDAMTSFGYTQPIADSCEEEFREAGVKSPLAVEDSEFPGVIAIPYMATSQLE